MAGVNIMKNNNKNLDPGFCCFISHSLLDQYENKEKFELVSVLCKVIPDNTYLFQALSEFEDFQQ